MGKISNKKLKWIDTKTGRMSVTIALVVITTASGLIVSILQDGFFRIALLVLSIMTAGTQAVFSVRYAVFDKAREEKEHIIEERLETYKMMFESIPDLLGDSAVGINRIARDIKATGILESDRWSIDAAARDICREMKRVIKHLSIDNDPSINVYYVKMVDEERKTVQMVGLANEYGETPNTYGVVRDISSSDNAYYDLRMFAEGKNHAQCALNHEDVDKYFAYSDRKKSAGKYEQFLFIPVVCDANKMIGLVEILAKRGDRVAETEDEMRKIQKLLRVYLSIFAVLTKAERAAIAVPQEEKE